MTSKISFLALVAGLAMTSASLAEGPQLSGVIEAYGLGAGYSSSGTFAYGSESFSESGTEAFTGASARIGVELAPNLSMQFDAWAERRAQAGEGDDTVNGPYGWDYTELTLGTAGHLTYNADNGLFAGLVAGLGEEDGDGIVGTGGVDFGFVGDTFRLYGQLGVTAGLTGDQLSEELLEQFAGLVGTYYLNDDFSISGRLQLANLVDDNGDNTTRTATWGASLDYRPESMPVIFSVGYQGRHSHFVDNDDDYTESIHGIYAGIRVPFGATADKSLKEQDRATGLGMMSTFYGKLADN